MVANAVNTNPTDLPAANGTSGGRALDDAAPAPAVREARRAPAPESPPVPPVLVAPAAAPSPSPASPPSTATTARSSGGSVDDRERQLALQGTQDSKLLLKQQLEQRVYSGKASETEIRLLISTCKDLGDRTCVQQARAVQSQR